MPTFIESPRFPEDISFGSSGGPKYSTVIVPLFSGHEQRNSNWTYPLHEYDVKYGIKDIADLEEVIEFFHVMNGAAIGFRFKDWADCKSSGAYTTTVGPMDCDIGVGTAGGLKTFQLYKTYVKGSYSQSRIITKPVANTVRVSVNYVEANSGWTVNTTTGIVTFTNAPAAGHVVSAGFEFDVPVRFSEDTLGVSLVESGLAESSIRLVEVRI